MTIKSEERSNVEPIRYLHMMDNEGVLNQKVSDIAGLVEPGIILGHGSSSGHLINEIKNVFEDSQCVGIDVSSDMISLARSNFNNVEFVKDNITNQVYEENHVDTIICSSTLHELWSEHLYSDTPAFDALKDYFSVVKKQLGQSGVFVIRGVGDFGDHKSYEVVDAEITDDDGLDYRGEGMPAGLLSTQARFRKFVNDFVRDIEYSLTKDGRFRTKLKNIWEFCLTKDYTNVWELEMTEEFCGFDCLDVMNSLIEQDFIIDFNRSYTNPWVKNNRLKNKVGLYKKDTNDKLAYPPTNFVIKAVPKE